MAELNQHVPEVLGRKMTMEEHCAVVDCDQSVAASIEGEVLCRSHFIFSCYSRLDRFDELRKGPGLSVADAEEVRRFVHECTRQADEIEHGAKDLDNLERAKLLHIILSASELGCYLRRSPRKVATIAVRLSSNKIGSAWEEDTETVLLSQFGASVRCTHAAKTGEMIHVVRADTGQAAEARVAWRLPLGHDDVRIGVEFLACENFWGLDWAELEEAR